MEQTVKTKGETSAFLPVSIRPARIEDGSRLAELSAQLGYPSSVDQVFARLGKISGGVVFVGEINGWVAGWIEVHQRQPLLVDGSSEAEVMGLVVDSEARRSGLGHKLMDQAEKWAQDCGCIFLRLRTNVVRQDAHAFYERLGYIKAKTQSVYKKALAGNSTDNKMKNLALSPSKVSKNVLLQPHLIQEVLDKSRLPWMDGLKERRIYFVGIGTSYYAAQIATWLWRNHVSAEVHAVHSFDFVRTPQPLRRDDVAVLFSHSGSKSFTLNAAKIAHEAGAVTVGITCKEGPWYDHLKYRLETCEREDVGVFTKSLTTALAWIVRWIGNPDLTQGIKTACSYLEKGPSFPIVQPHADLILIGDAVREWVAREITLKLQEAACLRARAFGLEEFLHGPRVSAGPGSAVVCFSARAEKRWDTIRQYLQTIEVPFMEVQSEEMGVSHSAGWLWQLFWGQRFVIDTCRQIGVDPDAMRTHEPRYKKARENLKL